MSFWDKFFKRRKEVAKDETPSMELTSLAAFEGRVDELLSRDEFVARSDYKPVVGEYARLYSQLNTLRKTGTLPYFCNEKGIPLQRM